MNASNVTGKIRQKLANRKIAIIFGILYLLSQLTIYLIIRDISGEQMLAFQTNFSKAVFLETIGAWKLAGMLDAFKLHFIPDYFHPIWYSVFLASLMALAFNSARVSERLNFLLLMPFIAGALDLVENTMQLIIISDIGGITDTKVFVAALAATTKWILVGIAMLMTIVLAVVGKVKK